MGLGSLSVELLINILRYLTPGSVVNMRLVSHSFDCVILTNFPHIMLLDQGMGDKFIARLLNHKFYHDKALHDKVERITKIVSADRFRSIPRTIRCKEVWDSLACALTYCCGCDWVIKHITDPLEWVEEWSDNETLLLAAWLRYHDAVEVLLDDGLDINLRHEQLGSLMYAAAFNDDDYLAEMLIKRGLILQHPVGAYGDPLQLAAYLDSERVIYRMVFSGQTLHANAISVGYGPFGSPLGAAAAAGHVGLINLLAYKFQSPFVVGPGSKTPLHYAASNGHAKTIEKLMKVRTDESLSEDDDGLSAFDRAIIHGDRDVVDAFLDFLFPEEIEETQALQLACLNGHKEIVQSLLYGHNIPPDTCVGPMEPPIFCAAIINHFEIVDILLEHYENGIVPQYANNRYTLLTMLASEGSEPMFEHILRSGKFDVNERDESLDTALHEACRYNRPRIVKALLDIPELDPNLEDGEGATAFSIALDAGYEEILELLVTDIRVKPV